MRRHRRDEGSVETDDETDRRGEDDDALDGERRRVRDGYLRRGRFRVEREVEAGGASSGNSLAQTHDLFSGALGFAGDLGHSKSFDAPADSPARSARPLRRRTSAASSDRSASS